MLNIKVFGTKTAGQMLIVDSLKKKLIEAELPFIITEETDVSIFIKNGVESVPAIQYDDKPIEALRSNGHFNKSLKKVMSDILESRNYGSLPSVVIPTDFSDTSLNALYYGHRLASQLGLVTRVLHVYFPSSNDLQDSVFVNVDFSKLREDHLTKFVENIDNEWGSDLLKSSFVKEEFRVGFPGENVLQCVEETNASYVIMGTTGDSNRVKKWFGSVSTKVMNDSPVPVLLIPSEAKFHPIKHILYAYDDYELDKSCIDQLITFANKLDAHIHFVHVKHADENENPGYYLKELIEGKIDGSKTTVEQINPQEISQALNDYATTHEIDLIAFGTKQKNTFQKLFKSSVTRKMNIHTTKPILIIKQNR